MAQETLLRAWEALPTLREPAAFLPWLKRIAAHAAINWHRPARPEMLPLDGESSRPACLPMRPCSRWKSFWRGNGSGNVAAGAGALPDGNRVALLMHVWEDASYEEIAAFTGRGRQHGGRASLPGAKATASSAPRG